MPAGVSDTVEFVDDLQALHLDPRNPRLPKESVNWPQDRLLKYIAQNHEPILIGRSLARFGFFASEPMITVIEDGLEVVVEGNRRLTALRLLTEKTARALVEDAEWGALANDFDPPERGFPIVRADSREAVAPIIGYRHIAGIQDWDPFPKARFITSFVDEEKQSFAQVAELVGESESDVRRLYRNYGIIEQAQGLGVDTSRAENEFGVVDRAFVGGIREYLSAPPPSATSERVWPLRDAGDLKARIEDVLEWLFGSQDKDAVATDSRAVTRLSAVLQSRDGIAVLKRTGDLASAEEAAGGPRARLLERLGTAFAALRAAPQDIAAHSSDESVLALLSQCEEALAALKKLTDD